ncbi:LAQU0S06e05974g1_1 [Lachancea quebecensis]|uniref:LAQU0S06e05974g1_1 n=1 Tax=Lachancea quebecensis TaxID=1654605 RepID=A0A0P1KSE9_9SACH|nr:LAQU0S06e05974g1_1 [Lachancea quebecensis]
MSGDVEESDRTLTTQSPSTVENPDPPPSPSLQENPAEINPDDVGTQSGPLCHTRHLAGSGAQIAMEQNELFLEYFHCTIISDDLSTIRDPKRANMKMAKVIRELIKNKKYKSSEDGKNYKLKWDNSSTFYLLKYCYEIGPFLGYESLKSKALGKIEQSSLMSLKWSCIWFNLLLSIEFENYVISTKGQLKSRFKYLLECAHPKIFTVTTGDERNPFAFTGDEKANNMLESLARLKNDAEAPRSEIQKLEVERQINKRNVGWAICNNSITNVVENLDASESESSLSVIDDVNRPNRRRIKRKRAPEPPWNLPLVNHIRNSPCETSLITDQLNLALTISITQSVEDMKRKDQELDIQQERLEMERQRQKMDLKCQEMGLRRQEMDLKLWEMKLDSC